MERVHSLINWEETEGIFNDNLRNIIKEISDNNYCDHEVDGEVQKDYLDDVFRRIDNFKYEKFDKYVVKNGETLMGKEDILIKQWSNKDARIQLLVYLDKETSNYEDEIYCINDEEYDDGYAIIYGDSSTFLILANYGCHPFIYHPSFTFDNSDGSTFEDPSYFSYNLDELKAFFKEKALEYLFNQSH